MKMTRLEEEIYNVCVKYTFEEDWKGVFKSYVYHSHNFEVTINKLNKSDFLFDIKIKNKNSNNIIDILLLNMGWGDSLSDCVIDYIRKNNISLD